ncbi:MAG: serine hydrolase [Acidobacteria bacterium]|nr:serine hydrolase [Acidobacteriota bacterium]
MKLILLTALALSAQDNIQRAIDYMSNAARDNAFMGAVLIAKDGRTLFSNGYGFANVEHGVPNTIETKFRIGGLSRQFTAASILQLEEQNKLKLTDSLCGYLASCPDAWKTITIQHLLADASGLPDFAEVPEIRDAPSLPSPPARTLAKLSQIPLEFPPGTRNRFSFTGYIALSLVIEKASGLSYAEYMQRHIFQPAGMSASGQDSTDAILLNRAEGYNGSGQAIRHAPFNDRSITIGASGLYATATDLLRWDRALGGDAVLKAPARAKLLKSDKLFDRPVYSHLGSIFGYSAYFLRFPEERLVSVVLSNNNSAAVGRIGRDLAALFLGEPARMTRTYGTITLPPETLDLYIGAYGIAPRTTLTIRREGNRMLATISGQSTLEITPESLTVFVQKEIGAALLFDLGPGGKPSRVTLEQGGRSSTGSRIP